MNQANDRQPLSWQQALWDRWAQMQQTQRLPHALLLKGASGIGKRYFARAFANLLLCDQPTSQAQACGQCKSCLLYSQGTHPDFFQLMPDEPGKPIKIDQVRQLNQSLANSAQQGGYRVAMLHPAEEMNVNAANALLKSLEEPGEKTAFLLVSDNPGRLMATIRSRCQSYSLPSPNPEQALEWLETQQVEQAPLLLKLSGGAPFRALQLHQEQGLERRNLLIKGLKVVAAQRSSVCDVAQKWQQHPPVQLLDWLLSLVADMVRYSATGRTEEMLNEDAQGLIVRASELISDEKLFLFADKLQRYRMQVVAKTNPNRQLMFEDLLIYWQGLVVR